MDKQIIEILYKNGYLTAPVNAELYKDVDDLINKGFITIPGAKESINKLLNISHEDKPVVIDTIIEDNIINPEPIVNDIPVTEIPVDENLEPETIIDEVSEIPVDETSENVIEEVVEQPKKKKTTKKTE